MNNVNSSPPVDISAIVPAYNEEACIEEVLRELHRVLTQFGRAFEIIAVDDGSTDQTQARMRTVAREFPEIRVLSLSPNSGQSAALKAGFQAARGGVIVTLDGDGQNDPTEIPRLLEQLERCDVCCGYRAARRDPWSRRAGSRIANAVRNFVLGERIRDTGCTLRAYRAEWVRDLPLELRGLHRFLPALVAMRGARVIEIPVRHRPRLAGKSKYTNWRRLRETLWDLWAVRWMKKRYRRFEVREVKP